MPGTGHAGAVGRHCRLHCVDDPLHFPVGSTAQHCAAWRNMAQHGAARRSQDPSPIPAAAFLSASNPYTPPSACICTALTTCRLPLTPTCCTDWNHPSTRPPSPPPPACRAPHGWAPCLAFSCAWPWPLHRSCPLYGMSDASKGGRGRVRAQEWAWAGRVQTAGGDRSAADAAPLKTPRPCRAPVQSSCGSRQSSASPQLAGRLSRAAPK